MPSKKFNSETDATSIEVYDGSRSLGFATVSGNTWTLDLPQLPLGEHVFTARSGTLTSNNWKINMTAKDPVLNLTAPSVQEAHPVSGEKERLNYYDVNGDIHVAIPDYGMKTGDTVKLYWFGRSITLGSPIKVVGSPPSLPPFIISKYEVIDVIQANASLWYTVKRSPSDHTHESLSRELIVDGKGFTIDAPSINGSHNNLRVMRQSEFNDNTTAEVRAIGGDADSDIWSSNTLTFGTAGYLNFSIDSNWLTRNRGKSVKFNCSLRIAPSDGNNYLFSQLLRVGPL
ncbi:hypothetical protein N5D61_16290 [Pseudomonas sp. GD03842]|uniref:hypothetical protein n=1 Tax=Pseudomonas sp. GD03842 TaxID=2975385 RepID=UPI0024490533|nr:hypothetical protein [Pseudomonas sp. GD03842]MDH0747896.1 hypothetical protein [Pseudomonas sp. GD03842]